MTRYEIAQDLPVEVEIKTYGYSPGPILSGKTMFEVTPEQSRALIDSLNLWGLTPRQAMRNMQDLVMPQMRMRVEPV